MAFYLLEPWGYQMENWRAALVASVVANTARDPKKKKPFDIEDFIPKEVEVRRLGRSVDQDVLRAKLDLAMLAWGGRKPEGAI